eukprot:GHVR01089434.1.p1 GENE.GHVR01089434.1~~GHVR01089434.1.p1  ORF type:complete len:116 (+),score=5.66 GHVR01089434.1:91-438(+)
MRMEVQTPSFYFFIYAHLIKQFKKQDTILLKVILQTEVLDEEDCPPIIVNAYDQDKLSRDFMGTTFIDVGDGLKDRSVVYACKKDQDQNGLISLRTTLILDNFEQVSSFYKIIQR